MHKFKKLFAFFLTFALVAAFPLAVAAATGDPAVDYPLIGQVLQVIAGLPYVGPYVVQGIAILAVVTTVFTLLATAISGSLKALAALASLASLSGWADSLMALHDRVMPWLKYLSSYNVKEADWKKAQAAKLSAIPPLK